MLKTILVLLLPVFLIAHKSEAAPLFFSLGGEKVIKVADFPQTADYQTPAGQHVDAGVRYKQVSILFIPIWNYEEKWCGYVSDKMYVTLTRAELEQIAADANVKLPGSMSLPFWDKIGGKLLAIALIAGYILYKRNRKRSLTSRLTTQPRTTTPPPPASDTPVAP